MSNIQAFLLSIFLLSYGTSAYSKQAVLAGGCFWCMESDFEKLEGVSDVVSGFTGGTLKNPTYKGDHKGHYEAVQITYDPAVISYKELLDHYWINIDPFDDKGQFCDKGTSYLSVIFVADESERAIALQSKNEIAAKFKDKEIVTPILSLSIFYPIKGDERYHQDYYKNSPIRYKAYRWNCGRDQRLKKIWGEDVKYKSTMGNKGEYKKPNKEELKKMLTPLQYKITQNRGTEPAFQNKYWDNVQEGIYVDIVSGEPLFSSLDKFKSNTGWPSFTKPLEPANIVEKEDRSWFSVRTEVLSKKAGSHLGHIFDDGPQPSGLRFCINSAALSFIPKEELEEKGYGVYKKLFEK